MVALGDDLSLRSTCKSAVLHHGAGLRPIVDSEQELGRTAGGGAHASALPSDTDLPDADHSDTDLSDAGADATTSTAPDAARGEPDEAAPPVADDGTLCAGCIAKDDQATDQGAGVAACTAYREPLDPALPYKDIDLLEFVARAASTQEAELEWQPCQGADGTLSASGYESSTRITLTIEPTPAKVERVAWFAHDDEVRSNDNPTCGEQAEVTLNVHFAVADGSVTGDTSVVLRVHDAQYAEGSAYVDLRELTGSLRFSGAPAEPHYGVLWLQLAVIDGQVRGTLAPSLVIPAPGEPDCEDACGSAQPYQAVCATWPTEGCGYYERPLDAATAEARWDVWRAGAPDVVAAHWSDYESNQRTAAELSFGWGALDGVACEQPRLFSPSLNGGEILARGTRFQAEVTAHTSDGKLDFSAPVRVYTQEDYDGASLYREEAARWLSEGEETPLLGTRGLFPAGPATAAGAELSGSLEQGSFHYRSWTFPERIDVCIEPLDMVEHSVPAPECGSSESDELYLNWDLLNPDPCPGNPTTNCSPEK